MSLCSCCSPYPQRSALKTDTWRFLRLGFGFGCSVVVVVSVKGVMRWGGRGIHTNSCGCSVSAIAVRSLELALATEASMPMKSCHQMQKCNTTSQMQTKTNTRATSAFIQSLLPTDCNKNTYSHSHLLLWRCRKAPFLRNSINCV